MIDIILLLLLALGFFIGFRRGLVLQFVYLLGFIFSFIIAYLYFDDLSPHLRLWIPYPSLTDDSSLSLFLESLQLEKAYYRAISFSILFFGTKILTQIIGSMLDFLADLPILNTLNGWLGGALGFVEVYFLLFFLLYLGALTPLDFVQSIMDGSILAKSIVENTPIISKQIKELWFEHVT